MIIHTIVVFPTANEKVFSACPVSVISWQIENFIRKNGMESYNFLRRNDSIYVAEGEKVCAYAYKDEELTIIVASDSPISQQGYLALFNKLLTIPAFVKHGTFVEMKNLIKDMVQQPKEAILDKIQHIQQDQNATKEKVREDIEDMIERGVRIQAIQMKTEELAANTVQFRKQAKKLEQRARCPFFSNVYNSLSTLIFGEKKEEDEKEGENDTEHKKGKERYDIIPIRKLW